MIMLIRGLPTRDADAIRADTDPRMDLASLERIKGRRDHQTFGNAASDHVFTKAASIHLDRRCRRNLPQSLVLT
jgi:hypothetical protein